LRSFSYLFIFRSILAIIPLRVIGWFLTVIAGCQEYRENQSQAY